MKLLSTKEAAEILGVTPIRVRQLISEGKLVAHRIGRDYAIEESALAKVTTYGKPGRPPKEKSTKKPKKANSKKV